MRHFFILLILALSLAGCSDAKSTTLSYEEVKKIMVDAIQTEEGKKAIRQLFEDKSFRELLILNTEEIKKATEETLLSKEAADFWKTTFDDPKFQETFAKSMQKQQEDLMKKLLNDASYQEDLTSFFGQPDMQKQLETILKGAVMRKELEKVVMETIENPLLQSKWQELVKKSSGAQEDNSKKKEGESSAKKEEASSQ
ncbi:spore gernimation protein [Solibacillus sp. MA9]|uniref:Spore gernimation protein n=1 Tax=Solibacillus palustris TaxID=2908203 RepID=A0ABS9UH39_9BACL|nr:spore germination lipoprotein GerD [Solibacillus sp. MA9]MCH7323622.1 spore gernimation protein [Solibacillus sp. MA9]